ncbi:MAG TPA: endolytic transglycosylase MltG, partial [Thermomicrobiales bacterium]|nr:endolytic transglycosylase MltG [Thermomicrobiales bacterium]
MTSRTRQLIVIGSVIVLALAIVFVTQIIIVRALDNPDTTTGESVYFTVDQGESVDSIADRLKTDGLIRSPAYFRFRVRIAGLGSDIIAGRYRIDSTMSTTQIIHLITSREAALAQEVQVRFVEGWRTEQYVEALTNAHVIAS